VKEKNLIVDYLKLRDSPNCGDVIYRKHVPIRCPIGVVMSFVKLRMATVSFCSLLSIQLKITYIDSSKGRLNNAVVFSKNSIQK
jgi:hypothetical protein